MMERHQSTTTYLAGTGFQHTRLLMQGDQRRTVMRTATAAPFVEIRSSEDWLEGDALGATVQGGLRGLDGAKQRILNIHRCY